MISKNKAEIEFGGEKRTFYFGLGFLGLFIDKTNCTLSSLESDIQTNPFKVLPQLMYYSLLYGYLRKDDTPPFTQFDIVDWMDAEGGVNGKGILEFMSGVSSSMNPKLPVSKSVKKKVTMPKV
tara:strand:- start:10807 stop:11175 length:369 start_codon:yes stop_codon:yes gene_type:complete